MNLVGVVQDSNLSTQKAEVGGSIQSLPVLDSYEFKANED